MFRWPPKPEYDDFEQRFHEADMKRKHTSLAEELAPTAYEVYKRNLALKVFKDYQEFGMPYAGGSYEQPHWWKRALGCVLQAQKDAQWEIAQVDAQNQEDPEEAYAGGL